MMPRDERVVLLEDSKEEKEVSIQIQDSSEEKEEESEIEKLLKQLKAANDGIAFLGNIPLNTGLRGRKRNILGWLLTLVGGALVEEYVRAAANHDIDSLSAAEISIGAFLVIVGLYFFSTLSPTGRDRLFYIQLTEAEEKKLHDIARNVGIEPTGMPHLEIYDQLDIKKLEIEKTYQHHRKDQEKIVSFLMGSNERLASGKPIFCSFFQNTLFDFNVLPMIAGYVTGAQPKKIFKK
jgi:hypothetical protein